LFFQFTQQAKASLTLCRPLCRSLCRSDSGDVSGAVSAGLPAAQSPDRGPSLARSTHDPSTNHELVAPKSDEGGPPTTDHSPIEIRNSKFANAGNTNSSPWNLYFRVTMPDALELGFLDIINRAKGTNLQPGQFLADCRARAGLPEIFEQSYLCNPSPAADTIVDWSAIERCRHDYQIARLHLDHDQIQLQFGPPTPHLQLARAQKIEEFFHAHFSSLFHPPVGTTSTPASPKLLSAGGSSPYFSPATERSSEAGRVTPCVLRLGFDVASSGQGNLACIYIDAVGISHPLPSDGRGAGGEGNSSDLWLSALLTTRTDDWHFLKTALFTFMSLPNIRGAGDASGLGRQICWEAANHFGENKFFPINFSGKKSDLGFRLMNELATAQKRFPKSHQDIAADFFALRKHFTGSKWLFTESKNAYNSASHCDIAWAGALASEAHAQKRSTAWAMVG